MHRLRIATRRSIRRSRKRDEALRALASWSGPVDEVALAAALRLSVRRLRVVLQGDDRSYRVVDSPLALGLVARVPGAFGPAYALTERGWAEVESLARLRASALPL